jgi:hypothetical protein
MDPRERMNDPLVAARAMLRGWQSNIWTSLPGIIQSYDPTKVTATVQPAVQAQIRAPDGTWSNVSLPVCLDVPVFFPWGGGYGVTLPLEAGDEGGLLFSSRCIDSWWQNGGVQPQAELRLHNLSDGMFIPGLFSNSRVPSPNPATGVAQLRTADGTQYVELNKTTGILTVKAPTEIVLDTPLVVMTGRFAVNNPLGGTAGTVTGDVHVTGTVTGDTDVKTGAISLKTHKHGGVTTGSGQTGAPV